MSKNLFEMLGEMEAPCQCDCGEWFDLDNGCASERSDKIICHDCKKAEEKEIQREEDIEDLTSSLRDARWTVKDCETKLMELGIDPQTIK